MLGAGTGHDQVHEYHKNTGGDSGDVIRLKKGIGTDAVQLHRNGANLYVELLDSKGVVTDSLQAVYHFTKSNAKVERIEADGQYLLAKDYALLIEEMAAFKAGTSSFTSKSLLLDHYWQDQVALTTPSTA